MKPTRMAARLLSATTQLPLPLGVARIFALDSPARAGVVAALAQLLLEAVRPARAGAGGDDAY